MKILSACINTPYHSPNLITQIIQLLYKIFAVHFLGNVNVTATSQITAERWRHISVTAPLELQVNPLQKIQCFK
jgi:hypothetical protein